MMVDVDAPTYQFVRLIATHYDIAYIFAKQNWLQRSTTYSSTSFHSSTSMKFTSYLSPAYMIPVLTTAYIDAYSSSETTSSPRDTVTLASSTGPLLVLHSSHNIFQVSNIQPELISMLDMNYYVANYTPVVCQGHYWFTTPLVVQ